jgi:LCP family protein required for cell wall assembly
MPPRPLRIRLLTLSVTLLVAGCALFGPAATPTPTPVPSPTPTPTPRPTPGFSPTPLPTPSPTPPNAALLNRRITVLFAGTDSTPARVNAGYGPLTDSMIVASVTPDRTRLSMVALPRDVVDIPLGNGVIYNLKANSIAYNYGMEGLEGALEATYGVPIDYWVEISMPDLPKLVDAVDGVWVNVPYAISDGQVALNIQPGWQRMNGTTALKYVRSRYTDSDYARARRQMDVLAALASRIALMGDRFDLNTMLTLLTTMRTNAPLTDLPTLLQIVGQSANAQVTAGVLEPPRFALYVGLEPARGYVQIANVYEMRAYVQSLMGN